MNQNHQKRQKEKSLSSIKREGVIQFFITFACLGFFPILYFVGKCIVNWINYTTFFNHIIFL